MRKDYFPRSGSDAPKLASAGSGYRRHPTACLGLCLALLLALAAPALADSGSAWWRQSQPQSALDERYQGPNWAGRVKWDQGYLEVMASGVADPAKAVNRAHAETLALKTARYRAYERLLEMVRGVRLTSRTLIRNEVLSDSRLYTQVKGMVRGARVISEEVEHRADGSVVARVRVGLLLRGKRGLAGAMLPWYRQRHPAKPPTYRPPAGKPAPARARPYTGLVLVAKGLGARPAMFPRVVEEKSGRVIYGPDQVDRDTAIEKGVAGYSASIKGALKQARTGDNPLIIKVLAVQGAHKTRLVVSTASAVKIYSADLAAGFLKKCRVSIVIQ